MSAKADARSAVIGWCIAFRAGKREALQDVLEFVQASLDHPQTNSQQHAFAAGAGSLARLIDYICVSQSAVHHRSHSSLLTS